MIAILLLAIYTDGIAASVYGLHVREAYPGFVAARVRLGTFVDTLVTDVAAFGAVTAYACYTVAGMFVVFAVWAMGAGVVSGCFPRPFSRHRFRPRYGVPC